jgi:hypothetical protein
LSSLDLLRVRAAINMQTRNSTGAPSAQLHSSPYSFRSFLLLWPLFFVICVGLGYAGLNRYDPRKIPGLSDTYKYYALTVDADLGVYFFKEMFLGRVLVPGVAHPFCWFARRFLPSVNAGFFGLLMANSLFCATTACLIVTIGIRVFKDRAVGLLGATLYLLSFAIPNLQLAGMIDSGEACFMAALTWSLLTRRWYLLPLWGVLGALAKESFVPFASIFAFTWWWVDRRESKHSGNNLKWIIALAVAGLTSVSLVHSLLTAQLRLPWQIAGQAQSPVNFFVALWHCLTERSFWLVFGWLLPLGVCRLKLFPRPWLAAAVATTILALLLGAYANAGGTIARGIFDIVGPLLSLSVAVLIVRMGTMREATA